MKKEEIFKKYQKDTSVEFISGYAINSKFDDVNPDHVGCVSEDGKNVNVPSSKFWRFKPQRTYIVEGTSITFFCEAVCTAKEASDNKTYYIGTGTDADGKSHDIKAWQIKELRLELGLSGVVNPRGTDRPIVTTEAQIPEYVSGIKKQFNPYINGLKKIWSDLRGTEDAPIFSEIIDIFEKQSERAARYELARWQEAEARRVEADKENALVEARAKANGVAKKAQRQIDAAETKAAAAEARSAAMAAELAEMRAQIAALMAARQ